MSIADVLSRVATIDQLATASTAAAAPSSASFADALAAAGSSSTSSSTPAGGGPTGAQASAGALTQLQEANALDSALTGSTDPTTASAAAPPLWLSGLLSTPPATTSGPTAQPGTATAPGGTPTGAAVLAAAESQVGVTEQPPGSNDGPQLAVYRSAVAGAQPGQPWCATFASWAAAQAGEPLGDGGVGSDSVAGIADWAARTGRLLPASATPAPGDLILFGDQHVGIVESVNPGGTLTTVEGNYANAVTRVTRSPGEATGYVQL